MTHSCSKLPFIKVFKLKPFSLIFHLSMESCGEGGRGGSVRTRGARPSGDVFLCMFRLFMFRLFMRCPSMFRLFIHHSSVYHPFICRPFNRIVLREGQRWLRAHAQRASVGRCVPVWVVALTFRLFMRLHSVCLCPICLFAVRSCTVLLCAVRLCAGWGGGEGGRGGSVRMRSARP